MIDGLRRLFTEPTLADVHYEDINCPRAIATCDVCGEEWFRGTCDWPGFAVGTEPDLFCMHYTASSRYWKHIRESRRHQAILQGRWRHQDALLADLPDAVARARAHQKLMNHPALAPLRALFR